MRALLFLLLPLVTGCGICSATVRDPWVVLVTRQTFAARFPDTPTLERRKSGILLYEVTTFPNDEGMP